jgi:hypothetical protein
MKQVRDGKTVSLSNKTITCGGGKFYTGFTEMPERVPGFVSLKEKYKKTPEMVVDFVNELQISRTDKAYLHFARIDKIPSFDEVEGLLFLPTPDILSGLATWTFFDNNASDAVAAPFGSGCCSVITQTIIENRKQGKRTFLGFFDPSVRPYFEADVLGMTGMYKEVMDLMRNIHIDRLPVDIHPYYYHIYRTVYGLMADYAVTAYEKKLYTELTDKYRDSLLLVNKDNLLIHTLIQSDQYNVRNEYDKAIRLLTDYLALQKDYEHDVAICG